jgi:hypothetical protein
MTDNKLQEEMVGMDIHSTMPIGSQLNVRRVPGGWIYLYKDVPAVLFVPLPGT